MTNSGSSASQRLFPIVMITESSAHDYHCPKPYCELPTRSATKPQMTHHPPRGLHHFSRAQVAHVRWIMPCRLSVRDNAYLPRVNCLYWELGFILFTFACALGGFASQRAVFGVIELVLLLSCLLAHDRHQQIDPVRAALRWLGFEETLPLVEHPQFQKLPMVINLLLERFLVEVSGACISLPL